MKMVATENAPKAIGPYSQAIIAGGMIYCSGCIPLNPETMTVQATDIESQTVQVIKNMSSVLKAAGSSLSNVVKTTVFLKDMSQFKEMNTVYENLFEGHRPARSTIQVAKLPLDVMVEIECVALPG